MEAFERLRGKEHPETLRSVTNLGTFYQAQGRYQEAEQLLSRALEASERVLGKEHPDTLASVHNLANLYLRPRAAARRPSRSSGACWRPASGCSARSIPRRFKA